MLAAATIDTVAPGVGDGEAVVDVCGAGPDVVPWGWLEGSEPPVLGVVCTGDGAGDAVGVGVGVGGFVDPSTAGT